MNEIEIENYLVSDKYISKFHIDVISYDEIPQYVKKPSLYVINTDHSSGPGKHWVCIFVDELKMEYFDSLGDEPVELHDFLSSQKKPYIYNVRRIQSLTSNVCGAYCILYCYFRSRGYDLEYFMNMFSEDVDANDVLVEL